MALALEIVHLLRQGLFAWRDGSPGRDTIRAQDRRNGEIHPASGCANNTIDINPNHVAMIKPSPDGDSGMVQILGFSGNSTDRPRASTVEALSVAAPIAGSGTLEAVPAQHV
jgi:hypothetical protein